MPHPRPFRFALAPAAVLSLLLALPPACQAPPAGDVPPPPDAADAPVAAEPSATPEALAADDADLADLRALAAEDPEAALNRMDDARAAHEDDSAFWTLYGEASLDLFDRGLAAGSANPWLVDDAAAAFSQALELDPADARAALGLARSQRLSGDPEGAWEAVAEPARRAVELGPEAVGWAPADLVEVGRVALALTAARLGRGGDAPAAAREGVWALRLALDAGRADAALPLADLLAWLGRDLEAALAAARGLALGAADADTLYQRLRGIGARDRAAQVQALRDAMVMGPGDPLTSWYLGEALFWRGREARARSDSALAWESWDEAERAFDRADDDPALRETSEQWRHLIRTQRGWTALDEGDPGRAAELFLTALRADPARLEPAPDPDTLRLGLDAAVFQLFSSGRLEEAERVLAEAVEYDSADADWWNNLGFFRRELALQRGQAGDEDGMRRTMEASLAAYDRAAALAPDDARILNDHALIRVYYLDGPWDEAEAELKRAIELGTAQLAALPEDVDEETRNRLDEAVGDAWENLAYLQLMRRGEIGDAESYLDESVRHYPFERRRGVQMLRRKLEELRSENP